MFYQLLPLFSSLSGDELEKKLKLEIKKSIISLDNEKKFDEIFETHQQKNSNSLSNKEHKTLKEQHAKCNEEKEKFSKEIEELKEENGILNQKVDILIDQLDRLEKEKKGEQENGSV